MAVATILTVEKKDLSTLAPEQGVLVFREILWAEASVSGIPKSCVSVPGEIFESDGGIDAAVTDSPWDSKQGIIKAGLTSYQIKTGKSDLNKQATRKDILFKKKSKELRPEVKKCLDNGGTLTIVHFGWDGPGVKVKKAITAYRHNFSKSSHWPSKFIPVTRFKGEWQSRGKVQHTSRLVFRS